jgi:Phage gp6-like head-tail connector protein
VPATLQIEVPPAVEPVTLKEAKIFLRVDDDITVDDDLIDELIIAARDYCETFCSRSFANKGYRQCLDSFPYYTDTISTQMAFPPSYYSLPRYSTTLWNYSQMIKLLISPLRHVSKIVYISSVDGSQQTLLPAPVGWQPSTVYGLGDQVQDPGAHLQEITAVNDAQAGEDGEFESGSTTPTWNATSGGTTTDGPFTWTNKGAAPLGDFIYDKDSEPPRIFPLAGQNWPSVLYVPNAVQIHFEAGYGDAEEVPRGIKVAMKMLVANWNENREASSPLSLKAIPHHVDNLLWAYRVLDFAPTRG